MVSVGQFSIHTMTSSLWATGSLIMYNESFRVLRLSHNLRNFTSLYLMPLSPFIHPLFQSILDNTLDWSSLLWVHHKNGSGPKEFIFLIWNSALSSQKISSPLSFFIAVFFVVMFAIENEMDDSENLLGVEGMWAWCFLQGYYNCMSGSP